ncbi:A/G-specific adenine glycosylase [Indiicoccus explosivorum]|uniref:A/G-specific adenine glycosylase n=1 Tax=Indiicoccus explosivorum TaxID=1917864 RepID=UPI000B436F21|nr:A/G-specific adenine glycosylase [Indiicoccus explosivorum]
MDIRKFQQDLIGWYKEEKRDLPWRRTADPYRIWVSEIMLQQTRVDTVIPFYERFLERFPTLESLAEAEEQELLKAWEGLGYYSRVRNLQAGVREVAEKYDGRVPDSRNEISRLKGVGPYTAGAVLSIAYGIPEHAVDGNVMRVLSRILLIKDDIAKPKTRKRFEEAVTRLISEEDPSSFNQGLMELGAIICTPSSPKCLLCPVRDHCAGFHEGVQNELPVKTKAKKNRIAPYAMMAIEQQGKFLLEKRPNGGLLGGMWQFPMFEREKSILPADAETEVMQRLGGIPDQAERIISFKHVFSHITWEVEGFVMKGRAIQAPAGMDWFSAQEMDRLPMANPVKKMIEAMKAKGVLE